jgi:surface protein
MFLNNTVFNSDISKWIVSNVEDMSYMFAGTNSFNQPIGDWDVSNVEYMNDMFCASLFNQNISKWCISSKCKTAGMFYNCIIENKYRPYKNSERL